MPTQQTISIDDLDPPIEDTLNSKNDERSPLRSSEPAAKKANDDAEKERAAPKKEQDSSSSSKPTVTPGNSKRKSPTAAKKQQSARSQMSIESFFNKTQAASSSPKAAPTQKKIGVVSSTMTASSSQKSALQKKPAPAAAAPRKSAKSSSTAKVVKPAAVKTSENKPASSTTAKTTSTLPPPMTEEEKKKRQALAAVVMMSASLPPLKLNNDDGDKKPAAKESVSISTSKDIPKKKDEEEEEKDISEPSDEPTEEEDDDTTVDRAEANLANADDSEEPKLAEKEDDVVMESVSADEETREAKTAGEPKQQDVIMEEAEAPVAKKPAEVVDLSQDQKQPAMPDNVSEERKTQLENYSSLCSKYTQRTAELMERGQEGLAEEQFDAMDPSQVATSVEDVAGAGDEFPDGALRTLLVMVQESTLPLSELTATCLSQLETLFPNATFTSESVSSKIKIVATRDSYIVHPEVAAGQPQSSQAVNVFEDTSENRMWRWEVTSLDLLPDALLTKVKKARTARRKLRSHFKALCKLIGSLRDADKLLRESSTPQSKLNTISTKISNEEEKVLKYEREEEKHRLADEAKQKKSVAKKQKDLEKQREKELKQKAKDEAQEQKRQQQEQKKKEAQAKKLAKEEKAAKEQREKERALNQQRTALMKFIHVGESTTPPRKKAEADSIGEPVPHKSPCVDSDKFWSKVNSGDREGTSSGPFSTLSDQAKASRKRRSRHVPVLVYVTVEPEENVFNAQAYAEQQTVHVSNRFRFLSFFEDCRPPYHGTWSKKSSIVTGAKPFGQDTDVLDYEVDSEAEWEEGDDDMGEDVESKADDDEDVDEDARDTRAYDFQDGWMAADDDLGDDEDGDLDDETKMLRKKKMQTSGASGHKQAIAEQVTVSIVAPMPGGIPFHNSDSVNVGLDCIEGIEAKQAVDMLSIRRGQILEHESLWLDAFPPALVDEDAPATQKSGSSPTSQEMSRDDLKVFVDFVHHCTYPSKDRVVEELRATHKNITSSRAQATRKLDAVANKRRNPAGGVIWEVNRDILEDLGMDDLLKKKLPEEEPKKPAAAAKKQKAPSDAKKPTSKKQKGLNGSAATQNVAAAAASTPAKDGKPSSATKKQSAKKRKAPEAPAAEVQLFAAFLKKKTKTDEGS